MIPPLGGHSGRNHPLPERTPPGNVIDIPPEDIVDITEQRRLPVLPDESIEGPQHHVRAG